MNKNISLLPSNETPQTYKTTLKILQNIFRCRTLSRNKLKHNETILYGNETILI